MFYFFFFSDSPKRFWWYHWACWILSAVGIFCILLAHDHYTIDVVVAYFITTRLFWWYHTMANQQVSLEEFYAGFQSRPRRGFHLAARKLNREFWCFTERGFP